MSDGAAYRPQAAHLKVLLLEDSRFDAELLRENLRVSCPGAQLTVVRDEEAFTGQLQAGGYDIVLSDFELPGYSGEQALQQALAVSPHTPFIFVSGVIGEDNAVELLKRGATDYVSKGRLSRLPVVIERAMREVAQRRARDLAERQLREADATFARVVDSLRDYAVVLLDLQGHIRSWNGAAEDIFGHPAADLMGMRADVLYTAPDRSAGCLEAELHQAREQGKSNDDRWLLRKDGSRFRAEGAVVPLFTDTGIHNGYCKIVRDTTAAYLQSQALRAAKEEAERANLAKDRFLAILSHELRTPLAPIAAAAGVLERTAVVPERHRDLLPMIQRNVALESRLIEDLLDLTALSAGKLILKSAPVDLHQLVYRVADMLNQPLAEGRLRLVTDLGAGTSTVLADEARMQQVIWNVLRNAIKFTPAGGQITLRTRIEEGLLVLRCIDSGVGIDAEALPHIFRPFEQAHREASLSFGGLGLGLAIARGLVAEHGGTLEATSDGAGRGAQFVLSLQPLADSVAAPSAAQSPGDATKPPVHQPVGRCRLLLVEDNQDAADSMILWLEECGYEVTHAASCGAALDTAARRTFDVVLTDLGLPDGSGIEIGRALSPSVPVVALSGYGTPQDVARSREAGFSGHLVKPVALHTMEAMLRRAVAERQSALTG